MQPPQQHRRSADAEMAGPFPPDLHDVRHLKLKAGLLLLWALVSFGATYFARDLQVLVFGGWPLGYWIAAQGAVLVFIGIVVVYGWAMNRFERQDAERLAADAVSPFGRRGPPPRLTMAENNSSDTDRAYLWRLHRILALYVTGVLAFLALMTWAEHQGLSRHWIGPIFLFLTVMVYAGIGVYGRTTDPEEYYVAGRRIPPMYNGMAAAADWMSAASFISLSGALYLQGFSGTPGQAGGLAYLLGWTGGFCLVAMLIAPHLRAMGLYTVPDFFHVRFGGRWPRVIAALAAVLCSFTYVVAQIYGVGLIASRLTGVQFEIGIMLGLGGVLLCSFLGGMRAITWTQVAQYVVVLLAFLIPVSWLAYKQLGNPLAPAVYGAQISKIADLEAQLLDSPAEHQVVQAYLRRAQDFEARLQ